MKNKIDYIEIVDGDLTSMDLDIIVNTANQILLGCAGQIELVTRKNGEFYGYNTNPIYGGLPLNRIYRIIPWLEDLKCGFIGDVSGIVEGWKHIYSGFGNHLLIRDNLYTYISKKTSGKSVGEIYE